MAGGAERVVSILVNELSKTEEVHLFLIEQEIEFEISSHVKVFSLNQNSKRSSIYKYFKIFVIANQYSKFCKENNCYSSLSFLSRANYINILSKFFGNKSKIIISERTYLSEYLKQLSFTQRVISKFLTKLLYPRADKVISNSKQSLLDLQSNFGVNQSSTVILNPLPLDKINQLKVHQTDFPFNNETFYFIHVGKFRREKNHLLLLNAFALISKGKTCELLLIGDGEERSVIENEINKLSLNKYVHLLGQQSNPYKYVAKANCLLLTSKFEGLPNVILEALAVDTPVISTDCNSGPREILAPLSNLNQKTDSIEVAEFGILIKNQDIKQLANAMELIMTNKELHQKLKGSARNRVSDFSLEFVVSKYHDFIAR
jgi:N-acetylgalactosamine-N,N'-diacetylbacillosaminyl-diphospho-undecaprenol 4-alpha-N-acetylgalactosaminyltransferase